MTNFIGKAFNPVNVWENSVETYTFKTVVDQNDKAVRFNDGSAARIVDGRVQGYKESK